MGLEQGSVGCKVGRATAQSNEQTKNRRQKSAPCATGTPCALGHPLHHVPGQQHARAALAALKGDSAVHFDGSMAAGSLLSLVPATALQLHATAVAPPGACCCA
jgi:hypothetical protein